MSKVESNETYNLGISDNILFNKASNLIEEARQTAYRHINESLLWRNWQLGKLIAEEELHGENRAKYGHDIIRNLSKQLTFKYGKGFTKTNLYNFTMFYKLYPKIVTIQLYQIIEPK